ncbi:hypothetical protein Tco_1192052 [Tanacetum coccineum]
MGYKLNDLGETMAKVNDLAGDEYRNSVLESIKEWIQAVPLQFLHELFDNLGDSISYFSPPIAKSPLASCTSSGDKLYERIIRWQLRLEYFAYETLQDLRITKLFEIIVDYPDSVPAIDDLKQCLEYTGQHSKLVDSFISSLRWEPDPIKADPLKGSRYRRRVDVLGMIVIIIGSKDQLINEYRVMLAENHHINP